MSKSGNGPRKPATKFPHLRKQMQKNALPTRQSPPTKFKPDGRKHGR